MPRCDLPRIPQDDDFQEYFLPGCHFSAAAGRQTTSSAPRENPKRPSWSHHCKSQPNDLSIVQRQYNQYKDRSVFYAGWPFGKLSLQISSMKLDQSDLNAIHFCHVLSKLLSKSRGTHHSFFFPLSRSTGRYLPEEWLLHIKSPI